MTRPCLICKFDVYFQRSTIISKLLLCLIDVTLVFEDTKLVEVVTVADVMLRNALATVFADLEAEVWS